MRQSRLREARLHAIELRDTVVTQSQLAQGITRRAVAVEGVTQTVPAAELRRRVANLSPGTYIGDILEKQDSTLYRWPERVSDALRVYVDPSPSVPDWDVQYPQMARSVFAEWSEAGFPLRFVFVYDSMSADLAIHWRDRFPATNGQRIGVTERLQTSAYLIAHANVEIALHDSTGRALSSTIVSGIIRHEVGHALGLNHANDPTSVMFREAATMTIGASDRATLRLLYLVPAGTLKSDRR